MGKTSLLNHLIAHRDVYLPTRADQPLVVAYLDLLDNISNDIRLYGAVLRELLGRLPADRAAQLLDRSSA